MTQHLLGNKSGHGSYTVFRIVLWMLIRKQNCSGKFSVSRTVRESFFLWVDARLSRTERVGRKLKFVLFLTIHSFQCLCER